MSAATRFSNRLIQIRKSPIYRASCLLKMNMFKHVRSTSIDIYSTRIVMPTVRTLTLETVPVL